MLIIVGGCGLLIDDGGLGIWIVFEVLNAIYCRIDEYGCLEGVECLAEVLFVAMGGLEWDVTCVFVYG